MARRTSTAWEVMEKPATLASPEEGGNSVVSILIVVVLPAPLEPSKPKISPPLTEREGIDRRECAETARQVFDFQDNFAHICISTRWSHPDYERVAKASLLKPISSEERPSRI